MHFRRCMLRLPVVENFLPPCYLICHRILFRSTFFLYLSYLKIQLGLHCYWFFKFSHLSFDYVFLPLYPLLKFYFFFNLILQFLFVTYNIFQFGPPFLFLFFSWLFYKVLMVCNFIIQSMFMIFIFSNLVFILLIFLFFYLISFLFNLTPIKKIILALYYIFYFNFHPYSFNYYFVLF